MVLMVISQTCYNMFALLVNTYGCEVWDATLALQNGVEVFLKHMMH
jgi:hypothetical protein